MRSNCIDQVYTVVRDDMYRREKKFAENRDFPCIIIQNSRPRDTTQDSLGDTEGSLTKIGLNVRYGFGALVCGAFLSSAAWAGSVCPAANGANPFPHPPDPAGTGCNAVVTINANGSTTVTVPDTTPFDNSEDVIIGVVNNGSTPLSSLTLSGPTTGIPIFSFDGDGICTYTFVGNSYCTASQQAGNDPQDYYGPTSTFSSIGSPANTGTVNFSPAVPAHGGTTYFSLEGILAAGSLTVTGTSGGTTTPTTTVPTLSTWGILLLAGLLTAFSVRTIWVAYRPQE
jgi:hypothetical protein